MIVIFSLHLTILIFSIFTMSSKIYFPFLKVVALVAVISLNMISCVPLNNNDYNSQSYTMDNSSNYDGVYLGIFPCANCAGIQTTVYINHDNTYFLRQEYLGNKGNLVEEKGTLAWVNNDTELHLQPSESNGQPSNINGQIFKFLISYKTLSLLNAKEIYNTEKPADHFVVSKNYKMLINKRWKLTELVGDKFFSADTVKKDGYIQFNDQDNQFSASNGCNDIFGTFMITSNSQITFGGGRSTKMSCPNMSTKENMARVLYSTKAFDIIKDELILLDENSMIIARLKASIF